MRSRCTARPPMAIPMAALITVPRLETRHMRLQARYQRSCPATLDCFRQEAPRVGAGQLATSIGCTPTRQELRIGQQLINLAVAKDPLGSNCCSIGGCAFEGSLVQRTHGLDIITHTSGAQRKLRCQPLCIGKPGAVTLVALTGMVVVIILVVTILIVIFVTIYVRRGSSVRPASDGMDQALSG